MRRYSEKDRAPVSTYEQAIMWLVTFWGGDWKIFLGADTLPPEAKLVCDMFWVTEVQLRYRLDKICRQLDREVSPAPVRGFLPKLRRAF